MKLGTLAAVGALVFGGLYVHNHADVWMDSLKREKEQLTAAVKQRVETERDKATATVKQRLATEQDKLKRRLKTKKDQAAAAARERLETERDKAAAALRERLEAEKDKAAAALRERLEAEQDEVAAAVTNGLDSGKERAAELQTPGLPQTDAAPAGMDEAAFWQLMTETRTASANDTAMQSELLEERLTQLSPQAIIEFAQIRDRLDERAYTNDLWGAAYVIEDGCSDDCFRAFRGYVISLGPGAYESALRDPDSLAAVVQDAETGNWKNAYDVAPDAYSRVTGADFPLDDSDPSGLPSGTPFEQEDPTALARRYPQLAARFG